MKNIIVVLIAMLLAITFTSVFAEFNPAGARLLIHAGGNLDSAGNIRLTGDFVPSGNLINGLYPMACAELKFKVNNWLSIAPVLGYDMTANEAILSFRMMPGDEINWAWIDFEFQPTSNSLYWFGRIDHQLSPKVAVGLELESFGSSQDISKMNNAGGINVAWFADKNISFDLALRASKNLTTGKVGPQIFIRCHVFGTD